MFQLIDDYILLPVETRKRHIDMTQSCQEIGGRSSTEFRGLLAHHLKTTIPTAKKVVLCHACNNPKCSNPVHLYWGTYGENLRDAWAAGAQKSYKQKFVSKYGEAAWKEYANDRFSKMSKSKPAQKFLQDSRINEIKTVIESEPKTRGWVGRAAKQLGVSHTQIKRYVEKWSLSGDSNPDLSG